LGKPLISSGGVASKAASRVVEFDGQNELMHECQRRNANLFYWLTRSYISKRHLYSLFKEGWGDVMEATSEFLTILDALGSFPTVDQLMARLLVRRIREVVGET
jgi:hypothetical protein